MEILGKTPINPIIFITGKICGYLTWIFLIMSFLNLDFIQAQSNSSLRVLAFVILSLGFFFLLVSSINLGKSVRIGLPNTKTVLQKSGIYRLSRNPMYVGFNLVTLASMIYLMNWIIIVLGIYSFITYHLIILGEEKFLQERFGEEYLFYKRTVRRYI